MAYPWVNSHVDHFSGELSDIKKICLWTPDLIMDNNDYGLFFQGQ